MSQDLGQQIVVDNRGGAGGNVGAAAAAKADPDGYTILMGTVATHAINPALYQKMPYDPVEGLRADLPAVVVPNVLVVNPDFPARERRGADRAAEGEARRVQLRLLRQRHAAPSLRRAVQVHGGRRHGARPLQRRAGRRWST